MRNTLALCLVALLSFVSTACSDGSSGQPEPDSGDVDIPEVEPDTDADEDSETDGTDDGGDDSETTEPVDCLSLWEGRNSPLAYPPSFEEIVAPATGTFASLSSPRAFDVNEDGCPDIVFGTGVESGVFGTLPGLNGRVVAVSGATHEILWETPASGDVFGSPQLIETPAKRLIVIGGRNATMVAIDALNGDTEWAVDVAVFGEDVPTYNFYSPLPVGDYNDDGTDDLVAVYGGDPARAPGEPREPSFIALVSGADGAVLAFKETPDQAESYTSPTLWREAVQGERSDRFVFGTGGETSEGAVYIASVDGLLDPEDDNWAREIGRSSVDKGVIAPAATGDIDNDGVADLVVMFFDGTVVAYSGADDAQTELWSVETSGEESNHSPAIARLGEARFGVVTTHNLGVFPAYTSSVHRLIEGADGEVVESWNAPHGFASSPLAVDLTGDGIDELLMGSTAVFGSVATDLRLYNPATETLTTESHAYAMGATPLVYRAAGHDRLELVVLSFTGDISGQGEDLPEWQLRRLDLNATSEAVATWGAYMGSMGVGFMF